MFSIRFSLEFFVRLATVVFLALPIAGHATTVRMQTSMGAIDIVLCDAISPQMVANFLHYVKNGMYKDSVIGITPGSVLQGGDVIWHDEDVTFYPLKNTYSYNADVYSDCTPHKRGTVTMVDLGYGLNTGTPQWFINLVSDGPLGLTPQYGEYAVIGEVATNSMAVVDAIASLPTTNFPYPPPQFLPLASPIVGTDIKRSNLVIVNAATVVPDTSVTPANTPDNYQGLWWNASESGWGINFAHEDDVIFATWFTYDKIGVPLWLTMTAFQTAPAKYTGTLYQTRGPSYDAKPFDPLLVRRTDVGIGTLTFSGPNEGSFDYTAFGVSQTKSITREVFGPLPTCVFDVPQNFAAVRNYTDLWWAYPAGAESGWGVNFAHQGETIFATWFTYDEDGAALWVSATLSPSETATDTYEGTVYLTVGPSFDAMPFLPEKVARRAAGSLTLHFNNRNSAEFKYTLFGISQSKLITRQVFRGQGTVCQ